MMYLRTPTIQNPAITLSDRWPKGTGAWSPWIETVLLIVMFAAVCLFRELFIPQLVGYVSAPVATVVLVACIVVLLIFRHRWARRAATAVRDASWELHAIVEAAPVAIITTYADKTIRTWNAAAERTFGWSAAEVVGRPNPTIPSDLVKDAAVLQSRVCAGDSIADHSWVGLRRDGSKVDISISVAAMRDVRGRVNGSIVVATDLTARLRAEQALAESEARLERIADNAPGMLYQFYRKPDGSPAFPYVSSGCRDVYGMEPEEVRLHPERCLGLILEEDRGQLTIDGAASAASMQPLVWEVRINHPRLGIRWIKSVSRPRRLSNGSLVWDGISLDVTAMKETEATVESAHQELNRQNQQLRAQADALTESELRFRSILDNSTPVIFAMDRDARILFHNRRFSAPHGGVDLVGRNAYELLPPAAVEQVQSNDARVWQTGRAEMFQNSMRVGGGRTVHLLSSLFPLTNAAGQMTALCVIATDITGQKAAEDELRTAKVAAERLGEVAEAARAELDRQNQQLRAQADALAEGELRFRSILDNSTPLIFGKDRQGRFVFVNREFAAVHGDGDPQRFVGKSVCEIFPAPVAAAMLAKDEPVWQTQVSQTREEAVVIGGQQRFLAINVFPLTDAGGHMTALCGICTDITAHKLIESELRAAKDVAERLGPTPNRPAGRPTRPAPPLRRQPLSPSRHRPPRASSWPT